MDNTYLLNTQLVMFVLVLFVCQQTKLAIG